jgi:hypothetical protein
MERRGGLQTPSKGKGPPARRRQTSQPTTCRVHCTRVASARSVKFNKRSTQPTSTIWCELCQTAARWKERRLPECTVSDGLWEECKVENATEVNATDKYKSGVNRVRRRPDGRKEDSQSVSYRTASGRIVMWKMQRKVNQTTSIIQCEP